MFELREQVEDISDLSDATQLRTEIQSSIHGVCDHLQSAFISKQKDNLAVNAVRLKYLTKVKYLQACRTIISLHIMFKIIFL